jgi:hypothetical protein
VLLALFIDRAADNHASSLINNSTKCSTGIEMEAMMREAFKARGRNCLLYLGTPTHQQSSLSCHTSLSFSSASTLQYSLSLPSTLSLSLSLSHSFSIEYSLCIEYFLYIDVESLSNSHARHMFGNVLHARHMFGNVQGTCSETCFLSMLSLYAFSLCFLSI